MVLSSSNAVASAGDWGGIYLEQNANLTLTYAHLSYTGYGINSVDNIKSVGITHSRLEFSGGGIYLRYSNDQTSTRVITDNVINVGTSSDALYLDAGYSSANQIPNISRNVITNPQGSGIYIRYAYAGLTIDANTVSVRNNGIEFYIQAVLSRSRVTRLRVLILLVSTGIKDLEFIFVTLEPTVGQITRSLVSRCRTIRLRSLVATLGFILMAIIKRSLRRSRAIRSPTATIEG